jgi:hypothetical protein
MSLQYKVSPVYEGTLDIPNDKYTADHQLKYKLRAINLMKYNPSLFTNRGSGLGEMMGGTRALVTVLGFGTLAALYRRRANTLRQVAPREAIWFTTTYFTFGALVGTFYSALFFLKWQIFLNDYYSNFLIKRFGGSSEIHGKNIYALKDVPNQDEVYSFSGSYLNSAHM